MQSNTYSTEKSVQNEHHPKQNGTIKTSNIFELVNDVVKQFKYCLPDDDYLSNLKFAESCLYFLDTIHPESIKDLEFDIEKDNLATFTGCLVNIIMSKGYKISYMESDPDFPVQILYEIPYDSQWYLLQLKHLNKIKNPGLKIGYAHLISLFDKGCNGSVTEYSYGSDEKYESTPMDYRYEDAISYKKIDSDAAEYVRDFKIYKKKTFRLLKKYDELKKLPLDRFFKCRPKDHDDIELKALIGEGLNFDYSVVNKFADDDSYDNGYTSHSEFHRVISDINNYIEEQWTDEIEDMANNNGYMSPCGYYSIAGHTVIHQTPPDMQEQLIEGCKHIDKVYRFLFNNKKYN